MSTNSAWKRPPGAADGRGSENAGQGFTEPAPLYPEGAFPPPVPPASGSGRGTVDLRFVVAPMMGVTHHAFRHFLRLLSRRACLVTEMIAARAIVERGAAAHLRYDGGQSPLLLQIGTADPDEAARAAEEACRLVDYDGININVGCPSHRVRGGGFGACLMASPERVAAIVRATTAAVARPVSVKCRLGLDDDPAEENLDRFVETLAEAGVAAVMVHARNAWLDGLDPRRNRSVPPLRWERVYRLKEKFPALPVVLNGGIADVESGRVFLDRVDGIMLGRAVDARPMLLATVDGLLYGESVPLTDEREALVRYLPYVLERAADGVPPSVLLAPVLRLGHGRTGARRWRLAVAETLTRLGRRSDIRGLEADLARLVELFPARAADLAAGPVPVSGDVRGRPEACLETPVRL